jgi:hypothetical protein
MVANLLEQLGAKPDVVYIPMCIACDKVRVRRFGSECASCGEATAARERRDSILRAWKTVPETLQWVAFENPRLAQWVTDGDAIAKALKSLDAPLVTLVGGMRAGKTTLAIAMLREHVRRGTRKGASPRDVGHARRARFVTTMDLVRERDETRLGEDHMPLRDVCERASVLVLDELGELRDPHAVIYGLLHMRHAQGRPTIVTTWLSREQCAETYGGVAGRLFDDGVVIRVRKEVVG